VTHDQLVALLERERISRPDDLEAERYRPGAVERGAGLYTPITEEQAEQNRLRLLKWPEKPEDD
jgi:hypothetical protein